MGRKRIDRGVAKSGQKAPDCYSGRLETQSRGFESPLLGQDGGCMDKPVDKLDIPAVGGYLDEYWEIDMGDKIVKIQKPADPVADMRAMFSDVDLGTPEEEKRKIHEAMREDLT